MSIAVVANDDGVTPDLLAPLLPGAVMYHGADGLPGRGSFDGLVVLGGRMSALDLDVAPWLDDLGGLMLDCATAGVPVLAICLGAQVLGRAAGGRVEVGAAPGPERGVISIDLTPQAVSDPILGPVLAMLGSTVPVPSMHADAVVDLPARATLLASSALYAHHAFRIGSALAVQFHPEASEATLTGWIAETGDDPAPAAHAYAQHRETLAAVREIIAATFVRQVEFAARR